MLFDREAIFGVVDFARGEQGAAESADAMVRRAQQLGVATRLHASGAAILGSVVSRCAAPQPESSGREQNVWAVSCGELIDRKESVSSYLHDPSRSVFLAGGFAVEGLSFLERLDGTFAAAIWREDTDQLLLICDRRADCRIFYCGDGDRLVFSSWLPLLEDRSLEVDRQAVVEFLRFLYIAPPRTIFRGVFSVEPGRYLAANRGGVKSQRLDCEIAKVRVGQACRPNSEQLDEFQTLMEQAVARRLGSRRTAVFLSSGVDSATIMAACQKINPGQVEAFTIGFDDVELDETNAARCLTRQLDIPHHELKFSLDQYQDAFTQMAADFEQPFGDPAGLPLVLASKRVAGALEVITGGTGGDDLFGAPIPRHLWIGVEIGGRIPRPFRRGLAKVFGTPGMGDVFDFDDVQELFITWKGWSGRDLHDLLGVAPHFEESGFYQTFRDHQNYGSQALYDALGVFPPDDCRFEAAALAGLPIELPYHDADVTAYVRGLPNSLRTSGGVTKILLRRLFARYFPEGQLPEKKRYFNIPLQALMARSHFSLVEDCLSPMCLKKHGLVDPDRAWRWIRPFIAGDETLRFKVWALLVLHAWLDARRAEG